MALSALDNLTRQPYPDEVSDVLGDRAMAAARDADLSKATRSTLVAAKRYAEGTGFRLLVTSREDLADVETLLRIKLQH